MNKRRPISGKSSQVKRSLFGLALVLLLLVIGTLAGCAIVKPWQRGRLGHPAMRMDGRPGDATRPHVLAIREGSVGAEGATGGGCGCN